MYETNDMLLLDFYPKPSPCGSHKFYQTFNDKYFENSDSLYFNDEISSSSVSPLSFDISDDFNEYNEALLTKLIEEFNQDPLLNPNEFDDLIIENNCNDCLLVDYSPTSIEAKTPSNTRKRKHKIVECDIFEDINLTKFHKESKEKKNSNNDAAFRYRQKQKINKSKLEEDLNKSAIEMVNAKNEMLEMRKKINTVKYIVKDLLRDKGFIDY